VNDLEHLDQAKRVSRYDALKRRLAKFEQAVQDLAIPDGHLRMSIGGGRQTFETFAGDEAEWLRDALLQHFRSHVASIEGQMAEI
jgi:hypothetical protein